MRSILIFLLFAYFFTANEAREFSNCALAKIFKEKGLDGFYDVSLANWVCMAKHESNYNTRSINSKNRDGSIEYGLFQVNNKWWCSDQKYPSKHGCNIPCSKLLDNNISDDIECVKRIVRDPKRRHAWASWVKHCKGKNLSNTWLAVSYEIVTEHDI